MTTATTYGAVTVINATATGRGCSLAVEGGVEATWQWTEGDRLSWESNVDSRLAASVHGLLQQRYEAPAGAEASTRSKTPPARGLKTSSSAAGALVEAALRDLGHDPTRDQICRHAVQASIGAGVTLTGAYDDQVAVVMGGCHVTDNAAGRILASIPVEPWHVAVWVPDGELPKDIIKGIDTSPVLDEVRHAESLLWKGDLPGALTANGDAFARLYGNAGLAVTRKPAEVALKAGASGAGLSGTGPAVAALFEERTELPEVSRGRWTWTKVVP